MMRGKTSGPILHMFILLLLTVSSTVMYGQSRHRFSNIHFYQLNTSHGLSDNYVHTMCIDKSGNLWIGTGEGLNVFNGKTVIKYFHQDYPPMQSSFIRQVECDDKNRIWVMSGDGFLSVIDEHRRFHKIGLHENGKVIPVKKIFRLKSKGITLVTPSGNYSFIEPIDFAIRDSLSLLDFATVEINGFSDLQLHNFRQALLLENDRAVFTFRDSFFIVDYKSSTVSRKHPVAEIAVFGNWDKDHLLIMDYNKLKLGLINEHSDSITYHFDGLVDQVGKPIDGMFITAREIRPDIYLFTTHREGIYLYDKSSGKVFNHRHNASDPTTIVNNTPYVIANDSTGWVFLGATPNGVSYFQANAVIGQKAVFIDNYGHSYDGYINHIETRDNNSYYIATHENLILWDRSTNSTKFMIGPELHLPFDDAAVNYVILDDDDRLWAALPGHGICVFDKNDKLVKYVNYGGPEGNNVPQNWTSHMERGPDGYIWTCTSAGIFKIDPKTFAISIPEEITSKDIEKLVCNRIWFQDEDNLWMATRGKGAWHYQFSSQELKIYNTENGLVHNNVFAINEDNLKNIYIGTQSGLDIFLSNGSTRRITTQEGLLNDRIEALLKDKKNRMWIGNDVALACYDIADNSVKVFDERYGLSVQGFRINSYHQNSDDELIWGTERGMQYFYPDDLYDQEITLKTIIHRIESRDILTDLTGTEEFTLSPENNFITFYFNSIDYSTHLHTFYQYKLMGVDEDWNTVSDQNSVRYNSLKPGEYIFQVRASNDNKVWVDAENQISFEIASHFWNRLWFRLVAIGALLFVVYTLIRGIGKRQKQRTEELETEGVINYFASRINTHQTTDELLWDVAKNCMSKLKFEDCVIYLVDEERKVLVQKAAYGPKSSDDQTIHQPIEIPVGQGISGSVALSGKAELVGDTTKDPRYIVDDFARQSELAVPIILKDKVIGVIDSEHPKKNFFTQKHLGILKTIAVLCVNQIERNFAEEEKQKAKIEVLQNKQKATESRLQSLRLQMNPHFLFNALNSIQQMILANEEMVATRYLSRFSKLLRSILIHSDKESISLKEELDILRLYVELESVRFKEAFSYEIICDDEIDTDEVKIPTLLIQPFVENAIWHGLMHKEGKRNLRIAFTDENDYVKCVIEDNGIGRQKSAEIKLSAGHDKKHTGKGIQVSIERLKAMHKNGGASGSLQIHDLVNDQGEASGTRVEINLPIQN